MKMRTARWSCCEKLYSEHPSDGRAGEMNRDSRRIVMMFLLQQVLHDSTLTTNHARDP